MLHNVKFNSVIVSNCYGVKLSVRYAGTVVMCLNVTLLLNSLVLNRYHSVTVAMRQG